MSSLSHHGIKGQRWGVRRFQNKDGTLTAAGKAHEDRRVLKKGSMVYRVHAAPKDYVYDNKKYVSTNMEDHNKWADYFGNEYAIRWKPVYYQRYKTKKDLYVATGKDIVDVVSTKLDKQMVKRDLDSLEKEVKLRGYDWDNTSKEDHYSMLLGAQKESGKQIVHELQKMGFGAIEDDHGKNVAKDPVIVLDPDKKLRRYGKTAKDTRYLESYRKAFNEFFATHTSIGGTMYIEGNALILGDSSYLEHHGIRGQRWGVRRFQNRDGSLTNAGRKRLGYATKGAVQTVGKAFKAGVKAGGNAVKAVKAHHEAAEAKKKEKKKEKASKTRLGVMANKDLFTNEEIRKLNERFKLEDEMKVATLQKGVEIAKAVGTIAQNVGTMAKAYEDVTGQSLSPIKRKAAEEKAKQDAEDRKRKLAKEDAETKRAEDKEKRDIEDRERRIKLEDEDRVRKQAREDADAKRAENAEKRAQAKEQRDSSMAVELQRKAKAAADEQEHKAVKAKAESRSAILDVLEKIDKIQDHDDDDHNNPPGGGIDTWDDDDYLNFFKKTGIIHSDISDPSIIQNGVLFVDSSDSLAHHGVKGQRWGVRRFQNEDGSLTPKGRKHYEKKLAKAERKKVAADAARGYLERTHGLAVTASAVLSGAAYAAMMVASAANPATIALGTAVVAAMYGGTAHATYSINEAWEGRGSKKYERQANEYREMLKQSDMEEEMYHVENGTLFINAGEPYLEHHGVRGMKWGKHLMAGKSVDAEGGGGGGFAEDDEKLKEMAKKAGMSVAEYRNKFSKEISRMNKDAAERKEGSHWALAKADVYGKTENHMPLLENKHKDRNAKEAMINNARLAETKYKAQQAAEDYTRKHTNSQKDINKWRNAAYLDSSNHLHKELAEARTEKAQQYYKNSVGGKIDRAKQKAGSALREAKSALKEGPSGVGDRIYDAAGGKYKKHAASNTKAAREDVQKEQLANRMANQQRAKEASEVRKKGGRASRDKGFNTVNGHDVIAEGYRNARKKHQEAASEANAKYEKSLAGKYDKMKADRARKKSIKQRQSVERAFSNGPVEAKPKKGLGKRLEEKLGVTHEKTRVKKQSRGAKRIEDMYKDAARGDGMQAKREKRISDAKNSVEKAARGNEAAYKHATEVYRQTGRDSDAYRQAIKRSQTTLWRSLDNQERLKQKRRRPADIGKKRAKHSDDANAVYTEGTRLVVNSKWG